MNITIDTQDKTITLKGVVTFYDLTTELEKRFSKEELKEYSIIPEMAVNPWYNPNPWIIPPQVGGTGNNPYTGTPITISSNVANDSLNVNYTGK